MGETEMNPIDQISAKLPVSDAVKKLNPHLAGSVQRVSEFGRRVRQDTKPLMNKLETEWYNVLLVQFPNKRIRAQSKRYRLGNGIWYKPDFTALILDDYDCMKEVAWEVKGPHTFRGGLENLKVAASTFPEIMWILVWKESGTWKEQIILK
jgi:hypothetical protein